MTGFVPPPYPYDRLVPLREAAAASLGGLVDLSIGTPCDPPPPFVIEAMADPTRSQGYPPSIGTPAYRDAARGWLERRFGVRVEAARDARSAVEGASLICTTTSAHQPILEGAWIAPGAHVNAVGSSIRTARELDTAAVQRAALFVDRRESALAEAGDFLIPRAEGALADPAQPVEDEQHRRRRHVAALREHRP